MSIEAFLSVARLLNRTSPPQSGAGGTRQEQEAVAVASSHLPTAPADCHCQLLLPPASDILGQGIAGISLASATLKSDN